MSAPRHRCRLTRSGDYNQFYIWDPAAGSGNAPHDWTSVDLASRAKALDGEVVICLVRNAEVPVEVGIWDSEPQVVFGLWQHVVEAPLATRGAIEVQECATGASKAMFTVEPGDYTVRVLFRSLDTVSEDGLQGEDFYEIQVWKGRCLGLRVIRLWP
jgi:hypothetical protein